jgi:hypothetical protein
VLVASPLAELMFATCEVLVLAKTLVNGSTITQRCDGRDVTYVHLLFGQHEIITGNGLHSNAITPGVKPLAASTVKPAMRFCACFQCSRKMAPPDTARPPAWRSDLMKHRHCWRVDLRPPQNSQYQGVQSRNRSLMPVLERVRASTRFTITAQ